MIEVKCKDSATARIALETIAEKSNSQKVEVDGELHIAKNFGRSVLIAETQGNLIMYRVSALLEDKDDWELVKTIVEVVESWGTK